MSLPPPCLADEKHILSFCLLWPFPHFGRGQSWSHRSPKTLLQSVCGSYRHYLEKILSGHHIGHKTIIVVRLLCSIRSWNDIYLWNIGRNCPIKYKHWFSVCVHSFVTPLLWEIQQAQPKLAEINFMLLRRILFKNGFSTFAKPWQPTCRHYFWRRVNPEISSARHPREAA